MKRIIFYIFCILIKTIYIYGQNPIQESDIPFPEMIHELPQSIIGEFVFASSSGDFNITIFSNNKYIFSYKAYDHYYTTWSWGHVVNIQNRWYVSPIPQIMANGMNRCFFLGRLQEIQLTETGFLFLEMRAIRKEDMPHSTNLAENISIPYRIARNQYFFSNNTRFDFNDIFFNVNNYLYSHALIINNGNVIIVCGILIRELFKYSPPELIEFWQENENSFAGMNTRFTGFLEIIEENENGFKGIIRFTNGVPYFYIEDGTALIEKINNDIIITMLYTRMANLSNIPEGFEFPARLVLEF